MKRWKKFFRAGGKEIIALAGYLQMSILSIGIFDLMRNERNIIWLWKKLIKRILKSMQPECYG